MRRDGEILKEILLNRGLTNEEFGRIVGSTPQNISQYFQRSKFHSRTFEKLLNALSMSKSEFLGYGNAESKDIAKNLLESSSDFIGPSLSVQSKIDLLNKMIDMPEGQLERLRAFMNGLAIDGVEPQSAAYPASLESILDSAETPSLTKVVMSRSEGMVRVDTDAYRPYVHRGDKVELRLAERFNDDDLGRMRLIVYEQGDHQRILLNRFFYAYTAGVDHPTGLATSGPSSDHPDVIQLDQICAIYILGALITRHIG